MEKVKGRKSLVENLDVDTMYHLVAPRDRWNDLDSFYSGVNNVSHFLDRSEKTYGDFRLNHGFLANILAYGCNTEKVEELREIAESGVSAEEKARQISKLRPLGGKELLEIGGSDSILLNPEFTAEIFDKVKSGEIRVGYDGLQDALTYARGYGGGMVLNRTSTQGIEGDFSFINAGGDLMDGQKGGATINIGNYRELLGQRKFDITATSKVFDRGSGIEWMHLADEDPTRMVPDSKSYNSGIFHLLSVLSNLSRSGAIGVHSCFYIQDLNEEERNDMLREIGYNVVSDGGYNVVLERVPIESETEVDLGELRFDSERQPRTDEALVQRFLGSKGSAKYKTLRTLGKFEEAGQLETEALREAHKKSYGVHFDTGRKSDDEVRQLYVKGLDVVIDTQFDKELDGTKLQPLRAKLKAVPNSEGGLVTVEYEPGSGGYGYW